MNKIGSLVKTHNSLRRRRFFELETEEKKTKAVRNKLRGPALVVKINFCSKNNSQNVSNSEKVGTEILHLWKLAASKMICLPPEISESKNVDISSL